jgi:hypothetical protein
VQKLPPPDWAVLELPGVRADLAPFVELTAATMDATLISNRAALAPLFDLGLEINSDFFPILDLGAERARYLRAGASGFKALASRRFDIVAPWVGRRPFSAQTQLAIAGDPRLVARARAARLRAARDAGDLGALTAAGEDSDAAHRLSVWQRLLATDQPPADWRHWVADMLVVEEDLHGGSAGVADEKFYDAVREYLARQHAPAPARDAAAFVEALARWDFAAAAPLADHLLAHQLGGQPWLPPELLVEGGIVAKLRTGDADGARALFEVLAPSAYREPSDMRLRLLRARVAQPAAQIRGRTSP